MTDEERKQFIEFLRYYRESSEYGKAWADKAADELERLAEEVKRLAITPLGMEAAAHARFDAEPVRVTDEMVRAASDVLFERTSIAFGGAYMREALEAALDPKQVSRYTAPPPAQFDAEPVAWRWRWRADPPNEWHFAVNEFHGEQIIIEPLYTAPPRPDASAGLIEAAEALIIDCENKWGDPHTLAEARAAITTIRARATDRSEMTDTLVQARQKLNDGVRGIINLVGEAVPTKVITVKAGDTLWGLAQRELGDGTKWPEIFFMNMDVIKANQATHIGSHPFSKGFDAEFDGAVTAATTIYAGQKLLVMTL